MASLVEIVAGLQSLTYAELDELADAVYREKEKESRRKELKETLDRYYESTEDVAKSVKSEAVQSLEADMDKLIFQKIKEGEGRTTLGAIIRSATTKGWFFDDIKERVKALKEDGLIAECEEFLQYA